MIVLNLAILNKMNVTVTFGWHYSKAIKIWSLYQINTLHQYHLPGKLLCVLIKLVVFKECHIEFKNSDHYDVQTMSWCPNRPLSVFSVTCNICGYLNRLARDLFPRPVSKLKRNYLCKSPLP